MLKNNGLLLQNLFGILSSIAVVLVVIWILDLSIQEELIFAFMLGLVTFLFFKYITSKNEIILNIDWPRRKWFLWIKNYVFFIISFFSIIIVILIPTVSNSLYVNWGDISASNWVRAAAALFISAFAPGYIILKFMEGKHQFNRIETLSFSILLSLFFTALFSYLIFLFNLNVAQFCVPIQLGILSVLSIALIFTTSKLQRKSVGTIDGDNKKTGITITYSTLILIWIICFALISAYFIRNYPSPLSDMGEHIGGATRFLSGRFSGEGSVYNPEMLYQVFLGSFFSLSGFPPVNAQLPLLILTILPYLTFYVMISAFFNPKIRKSLF